MPFFSKSDAFADMPHCLHIWCICGHYGEIPVELDGFNGSRMPKGVFLRA